MTRLVRAAGTAAAAVLAALTLSACGATLLGSAAVVDGERISLSEIEGTVAAVRDMQEVAGVDDPRTEKAAQNEVHRQVTGLVFAKAARDLGVTVTDGELDARAAQERAAAGGEEAFAQGFALQNRITPQQVYDELRRAVLIQKLTEKVAQDAGVPVTDDSVRPRLTQLLIDTAQKMKIKINPRYGRFDALRGELVEARPDYYRPSPEVSSGEAEQP